MGYIGKTAKMERLAIFNPVNGIFGANFTPWAQKGNLRDLSGHVWGVRIFSRVRGVPERVEKWSFLTVFSSNLEFFTCWTP